MQHFRFDQPSSYLTPLPLFSDNVLVDTKPSCFERVNNTRITKNYKFASTERGSRFFSISDSTVSPATSSTPCSCNHKLRSTFEPIPRNARYQRPTALQTSAPVSSEARQHSAIPRSQTCLTMQNQIASGSATMYQHPFPGLFQGFEQTPVIIGTASALQKLTDARKAGLFIAYPAMSAVAAVQQSLQPFQAAGVFPTDEEMTSLFSLTDLEQRACGFDKAKDFSITDQESAHNIIMPPLVSLRAIDCARQYMEIGNRHRHGPSYCFDVLIITLSNGQLFVHDLPAPSNSHSTHSVLMLRQLMPGADGNVVEIWRASATSRGIPLPRPDPLSSAVPSSSSAPPSMPSNVQPAQSAKDDDDESDADDPDPLAGVTDSSKVEGDLILRAAMRYTNKEIYEKIKALGSTATYNSVTKRITNALKAQARAELGPGEAFDAKYDALRNDFDARRRGGQGRLSAKRSASSMGGGKSKRQKTASKGFVADDDSDLEDVLDGMDIQDEEVVGTVEYDGNGGGNGYSLRRRTPRNNVNAEIQGVDEADEDMEDDFEREQSADESDVSEFDDSEE
ncbi:hypothetical protein CERZMDRAFT_102105 [Cercospora zeae-maydis SCOH1-5]|uniref:Uncharacterized protein n=1 Tax=Cercospora zeae-maydis SCOH1-5 TaxID=717836 RepID=A0A6A6F058_9PEZI|nr:hypothetical protein CERZMDRAFT_102105 [Cercospora zeae-maydis SCOH1-5]